MRAGKDETPDIRWLVGTPYGDAPIKIHCPFHNDDTASYAIYPDHGFCFGCRAYETAEQFIARLGASGDALPRARVVRANGDAGRARWRDLEVLVDVWHRVLVGGPRQERLPWLTGRGLWLSSVTRWRLGHTGDRFVVPVWDGDQLTGYQLRLDPLYCDPDEPKYQSPKGVPTALCRPNPRGYPTAICEGPLDAMLLAQYGIDAVTTTGGAGSLAKKLSKLVTDLPRRLVIVTDLDPAGDEAAAQLLKLYPQSRRATWDDGKDVGEALLSVPAWRRATWLREVIGG